MLAYTCTQPLISIFRCKPDAKYRWIFDWVHGKLIGRLVIIFACECAQGRPGASMLGGLLSQVDGGCLNVLIL